MLVHPSSDGDDDKSKWVQTRLHEESYTGDRGNSRAMMSNGIEFLDLTSSEKFLARLRPPAQHVRTAGPRSMARPEMQTTASRERMMLLDTQVWVWWTEGGEKLSERHRQIIDTGEAEGIAACAFSVWEVAMLVSKKRLELREPVQQWLDRVVRIPTLHLLPASPQILLDSTRLPGSFHKDPADRILVATARAHSSPLLTTDENILAYGHVPSVGS